jgi:hypothetical protein
MLKTFISNNRVILSAIVGSLSITLTSYLQPGPISYSALGLAALIAVLGVLAKEWQGKSASVLGIFGSAAGAVATMLSQHAFSWASFGVTAAVAVLGFLSTGLQGASTTSTNVVNPTTTSTVNPS